MAEKLYFKIGEACKQLDIQPYVLRYWETEFAALSPDKSKSGQRVYSRHDLAVIRRIKELLYDEGFTIAGAKKKLEGELRSGSLKPVAADEPAAPDEPAAAAAPDEPATPDDRPAQPEAPAEPAPPRPRAVKPAKRSGASASEAKRLRQGVRDALKEARAILAILEDGDS